MGSCPHAKVMITNSATENNYSICELTETEALELVYDPIRNCILGTGDELCIECRDHYDQAIYSRYDIGNGEISPHPVIVECTRRHTPDSWYPLEYTIPLHKLPHAYLILFMSIYININILYI